MKRFLSILTALLTTLSLSSLSSAADTWGPWEAPTLSAPKSSEPAKDDLSVLKYGVRFFQHYISPVDGPRCPMYPTCSAYALQAIDKHGPVTGIMMSVDRLLHETDPREHRYPLSGFGRIRYADPLTNNDFWLEPH